MPYLLVKTTLVAVILGLSAFFAQAEATPGLLLNKVTTPTTPVGYGYGYGGYGRGYGRWYGGTAADTAAGTVDMAVAMAGMADTADMAVDAAANTTDER